MQFQVPQFLDVEDKVIGPLTIKQFLYIVGSVGLGYMSYRYIPYLGLLLGFGFLGFGGALGFYRPNKKPFADMLESAFNYIKGVRLYVWKRIDKKPMQTELNLNNFQTTKHAGVLPIASTGSKLSDLTWTMDVATKEIPLEKTHSDSAII
jgi:hypothetical protein